MTNRSPMRFRFCLYLFPVLFALSTPSFAVIVENFEDPFTNGVGSGWTKWNDTWGEPNEYAAQTGATGAGSCQGVRIVYGSGGVYRQNVAVTPGAQYVLRVWIRTLKGDRTAAALPDNSVVWAEFGYDLQNRGAAQLGSDPQITYWDSAPKQNANLGSDQWQQFSTPQFTATGSQISIWTKCGSVAPEGLYYHIDDIELIGPSAATNTPGAPTATPQPTVPQGQTAWKLEYARQYGRQFSSAGSQAEVFASEENGSFVQVGITNKHNPTFAIFGQTNPASNPFTPGNLRIVFQSGVNAYDFQVYDPPRPTQGSPDCFWEPPLPYQYSFEFWYRRVSNDALWQFAPTQPVYHYDRVVGFNTSTTEPQNFDSDAYSLTDWTVEHWQTFKAPNNINRIISAKAFAVTDGPKFRMVFSIHQGGVGGPQIGPSVTSREVNPNEFKNVKVDWALDAVPVVPGGIYAMKVRTPGDSGFNMYATNSNNYLDGILYTGSTAVPGRDMIAVIVGANKVTAPAATPTATPPQVTFTPTRTRTATPSPTATLPPAPVGVHDYSDLFNFASRWYDNETSFTGPFFETGYDFVRDGEINALDLLTIFDAWHKAPPTATPAPATRTPTATSTVPAPTVTPVPTTQLLQNPSFEAPAAGSGQPTGWVHMGGESLINNSQYTDVEPPASSFPNGSQVARAYVKSYDSATSPHGWSQQVSVLNGHTYELSGYLWTSTLNANPNVAQGRIGVDLDGASSDVNQSDIWCGVGGNPEPAPGWRSSEQQWTRISTRLVARSNTITVYVDSQNTAPLEWTGVHFDLVELREVQP